jgi:hypothetical protein
MDLIGVSEVWRIFEWAFARGSERDERARQALIEWLDGIYKELEGLSESWIHIIEWTRAFEGDVASVKVGTLETRVRQTILATRLRAFCDAAPIVLEEATKGQWRHSFVFVLSNVLARRDEARALLDSAEERGNGHSWMNKSANLEQFREAGTALQQQIAALQAQIRNIKLTESHR